MIEFQPNHQGPLCVRVLRGARCGSSARRDLRGGRRITGVPTSIDNKMNKRIAYGCLCPVLVLLLLLGLLFWAMFGDRSSYQTKLNSHPKLPTTASDITIYQNKNITGNFDADFRISEHDFASFAAEHNWDLQPISEPMSIRHAKACHEGEPNDMKEITNGLYYSKRAANGGGVTMAYDRDSGRGYIDSSSR